MSIDLTSYNAIDIILLVKIECDYFVENPGDTPVSTVIPLSTSTIPIDYDGTTYIPAGILLQITGSPSEIRNSQAGITITLSGIPNDLLHQVLNSRFKGSRVSVYRRINDSITKQMLAIADNPTGRFFGRIDNFSINEDFAPGGTDASSSVSFMCTSATQILDNKITGRRTNGTDQKKYFPNDLSMDRVSTITKTNFNFGFPAGSKTTPSTVTDTTGGSGGGDYL